MLCKCVLPASRSLLFFSACHKQDLALFLCKCCTREESWDLTSEDHNAQLCTHSIGSRFVLHRNEHS